MHRLLAIALSSTFVLQVVPLTAAPRAGAIRARDLRNSAESGVINGTVQSAAGRVLAGYGVQVRNLDTGTLARKSTSNAQGAFSFTGLPASSYVVEVVSRTGEVVSSNAATPAVAGNTLKMAVSATTIPGAAAASAGAMTTAAVVTRAAASAAITGMAAPAGRDHASPSR